MPINAHEPFRDKLASFILTNCSLWRSRREGEGPGGKKEGGRGEEGQQGTEEKGETLGKDAEESGEDQTESLQG